MMTLNIFVEDMNKNNILWTQFIQDFMFFMLTACGKVLVEERLQE